VPPGPHDTPHPPQLFGSDPRSASQPFIANPSQFPNPALHEPMPQLDALHARVAFGGTGHTTPQPPQLFTSPVGLTHAAEQQSWPTAHIPPLPHGVVHSPAEHRCPAPHALPHAPQFAASDPRSASHPFRATRSQSANPRVHEPIRHVDAVHAGVPLATGGQTSEQAPQFSRSLVVSVHVGPQHICPAGQPPAPHGPRQRPAEHRSLAPHARPHAPQLAGSLPRLVSHPDRGLRSQSAKPGAQRRPHAPPEQIGLPLITGGHALPHPPQLVTSMVVFEHSDPQHV